MHDFDYQFGNIYSGDKITLKAIRNQYAWHNYAQIYSVDKGENEQGRNKKYF